jgi:uncharacterized protein
MLDLTYFHLLVFLVGFFASFIGTISVGAGLVSLPLLFVLGFPPQIAIATNKFGLLGFNLGPLKTYQQNKKILWKYVLPFTIVSIVGSAVGAKILLSTDSATLSKLVGVMLLLVLVVLFIKKDLGVQKEVVRKATVLWGYLCKFLVSVWHGFFGAGAGIFAGLVHFTFFGFTITESKATGKIPSIVANIIALVIFAIAGVIDYHNGVVLLVGMLLGGYVGGHVIIKKGDQWAKKIIMGVILVSAIKLLLYS